MPFNVVITEMKERWLSLGKCGRGSHIFKLSGLLSSRRFTLYVKHWVVQAVGHWSALSWQDLLPKDNLSGEWAVTSA